MAYGHVAQSAFRRRVIDLDGTVVTVAQQRRPEFERVHDRRRRVGLARQRIERGAQPALEGIEQRTRAALPNLPTFVRRLTPDRMLTIVAACIRGNGELKICVHNRNLWAQVLCQNSIMNVVVNPSRTLR